MLRNNDSNLDSNSYLWMQIPKHFTTIFITRRLHIFLYFTLIKKNLPLLHILGGKNTHNVFNKLAQKRLYINGRLYRMSEKDCTLFYFIFFLGAQCVEESGVNCTDCY
jgi:hypothetical protein